VARRRTAVSFGTMESASPEEKKRNPRLRSRVHQGKKKDNETPRRRKVRQRQSGGGGKRTLSKGEKDKTQRTKSTSVWQRNQPQLRQRGAEACTYNIIQEEKVCWRKEEG